MAIDRFGRHLQYLRISLTDRCNMRCVYCMPQDVVFRPTAEMMTDEEVLALTQVFSNVGFTKIRLTGGEPTVRPNLVGLVKEISQMPGITSLTMTTNGARLEKLAEPLKQAGLQRVNISLDSLNSEHFHRLTHSGNLEVVWRGIQAAEAAGLTPIKLNTVVVRGWNDEDVFELARLTLEHDWQVRFIELMPFAGPKAFQLNQRVTEEELKQKISPALGGMTEESLDGEARIYRLEGARGRLGFISSISHPFCADCTRARLTADGKLRLCLLRDQEIDLLSSLRAGANLEDLRQRIVEGLWLKPWGHGLAEGVTPEDRSMNEIGG
jgi:GTP 3',8-cyclase